MKNIILWARSRLLVEPKLVILYFLVYLPWGFAMDWVGNELEIARFTHWWQVITVYGFYMIPISLLLRGMAVHTQYAYGLIAMGLLEFGGYALGSSYAFPENILDTWFGIRNFSLAMSLFFAWYFPLGNWVVTRLHSVIFKDNSE